MKRKQLKLLKEWYEAPHRKPLIVRGARQVGKSTLIEIFAKELQIPLTTLNLERNPGIGSLFGSNAPQTILDVISTLPEAKQFDPKASVLFIDEIQSEPEAISALRYFYEDMPELPLVAAGSLLEFALNEHKSSMPVGRISYLHMGPMTFTEFLEALDEDKLAKYIQEYDFKESIHSIIHDRLLEQLKLYFFIGGMPEAVKAYAESKQLKSVSEVHTSIIDTYREDFPKYIGSRNLARIQHVFNFAARTIGNKVKYSHFSADDKSNTIKQDINLLCMARVLHKVSHSDCNGLPIQAEINEKTFKLLFLDVGLMNGILGLNWFSISRASDMTLVSDGQVNEQLAEQFVGQHLLDIISSTTNRQLTYWLRDGKGHNAEVDYVISLNGHIIPIEVKAGSQGSLRSLHQFMSRKKSPFAIRFDACLPSVQIVSVILKQSDVPLEYPLVSLPLYMVERLEDPVFIAGLEDQCTELMRGSKQGHR